MSPESGPLVSIGVERFAVLASSRSTLPLRVATQTTPSPSSAIPSGLSATLTLFSALPVVASKRTTSL